MNAKYLEKVKIYKFEYKFPMNIFKNTVVR